MARLDAAFEGAIARVVMVIRSQDLWWSSVAAYGVGRGHPMPDASRIAALADAPRTWRDVITDMACALPDTQIKVLPFEQFAGRSDKVLEEATGRPAPLTHAESWLIRSPNLEILRAARSSGAGPRAVESVHTCTIGSTSRSLRRRYDAAHRWRGRACNTDRGPHPHKSRPKLACGRIDKRTNP